LYDTAGTALQRSWMALISTVQQVPQHQEQLHHGVEIEGALLMC
jgi:hypothetical protein